MCALRPRQRIVVWTEKITYKVYHTNLVKYITFNVITDSQLSDFLKLMLLLANNIINHLQLVIDCRMPTGPCFPRNIQAQFFGESIGKRIIPVHKR